MQNNKKQCKQTQKDEIMQEMSGKGICGKMKKPAATYFHEGRASLSSAPRSLTSVFGMGTGIPSSSWPPEKKQTDDPKPLIGAPSDNATEIWSSRSGN